MKNHDISIGEMIDADVEARIGLLGRDPEIQFVRLAAEYNEVRMKLQTARTAISEMAHGRQSMRDYANAVLVATSVDASNPSHQDGAAPAPSVDGVVGSLNQEDGK